MAIFWVEYHSTMRRFPRFLAALLAVSLVLPARSSDDLPELGDIAGSEFSVAAERRIGLQIMHEIRWREPAFLDDPDVEAYLNQLGGRLAAVSADPGTGFYFFAINDPAINAFAMPGGYIGVHAGLILAAQSESELAGVMAHEIAHVTQRHIARQVFQSKKIGMASMVAMGLALLAARSNGQVAGAAAVTSQAGAISAQLAFSRDFERESDRVGFDLLSRAGFDPRGMSLFFERLQKAVRLYENNATAYLRTHPLSGERVTDMQNRELQVPYRQIPDSVDFQLVRARLRAQQGIPAEAVRDFENLLAEGKHAQRPAALYGLAQAQFRARNWPAAEKALREARTAKNGSAMIEHLLADVRIAQGDVEGGLAIYRSAAERFPRHHGLVFGYAAALVAAKRYPEALRFVDAQLSAFPDEVRLYRLRAESYAGLGRRAPQHLALAEAAALQGQTQAAIEQLNLAQRAGDANFFENSTIDARQRELKQRRIDEMKEKRN